MPMDSHMEEAPIEYTDISDHYARADRGSC